MCGLVGILTPYSATIKQENVFKNMLYADALRGHHSTGVFAITIAGAQHVVKDSGSAIFMLQHDAEFSDLMRLPMRLLFGHNRYATMGAHTKENAHPFTHGDVTLAHNGTLTTHRELTDDYFQIDSEAVCKAISMVAPEEATSVIEKLDGAYALQWFDERDNTLNFARNDERPLAIAAVQTTAGLEFMAWASEPKMLEWCLERQGFYNHKIDVLPVGKHYKFKVQARKEEPVVTDFTPCDPWSARYSMSGGNRFNSWNANQHVGHNNTAVSNANRNGRIAAANAMGSGGNAVSKKSSDVKQGNNASSNVKSTTRRATDQKPATVNNVVALPQGGNGRTTRKGGNANSSSNYFLRKFGLYVGDMVLARPAEVLEVCEGQALITFLTKLHPEVAFEMRASMAVAKTLLSKAPRFVCVSSYNSQGEYRLKDTDGKMVTTKLSCAVESKLYSYEEYSTWARQPACQGAVAGTKVDMEEAKTIGGAKAPIYGEAEEVAETVELADGSVMEKSDYEDKALNNCAVCAQKLMDPETSIAKGEELIHEDCEDTYLHIMEAVTESNEKVH